MKCDTILKESIAVVSDSGHDDYDADENEIESFDWKAISHLHDFPCVVSWELQNYLN